MDAGLMAGMPVTGGLVRRQGLSGQAPDASKQQIPASCADPPTWLGDASLSSLLAPLPALFLPCMW